jgi:hypothetical protein
VCPKCPEERRKLRKINGVDECWWNNNWENGNYDITKNFGAWNYLMQYLK